MHLDSIDRQILRLLQENARISNTALAEAVGLSPNPLAQRLKKLEGRGVIQGYTVRINPEMVDRGTLAFVGIKQLDHQTASHHSFLEEVAGLPEVIEVHHVAGEEDFLLKVAVRDMRAYEHFLLERLARIPGLDRVRTVFVLSTPVSGAPLPIGGAEE
ncbi:MAG: Lrp/AsnC family transcriptional regulator [Candidatus Xenobium sp.]|nr:Lrp/AsnC family transcriptional regulator [Burkholderiales bacterium]